MGLIETTDTPAVHLTTATGKEVQVMPFELWQAVNTADLILRKHGMQMVILCEHCHGYGHPHPVVSGDNLRNGTTFTMTCAHLERRMEFRT